MTGFLEVYGFTLKSWRSALTDTLLSSLSLSLYPNGLVPGACSMINIARCYA